MPHALESDKMMMQYSAKLELFPQKNVTNY